MVFKPTFKKSGSGKEATHIAYKNRYSPSNVLNNRVPSAHLENGSGSSRNSGFESKSNMNGSKYSINSSAIPVTIPSK
jgi:hypothetical protein